MPSNPKLQRLIAYVREHHGGEDALLGLLRSGWTGVKIARRLEQSAEEHGIARDTIALSPDSVRLMLKRFNEEAYQEALKEGAATLMDETIEIADNVGETREAVSKAKLQVDVRANIAGKLDRERWGDQPGPAVQISVGQAFLAAVARPSTLRPPARAFEAQAPKVLASVAEVEELPAPDPRDAAVRKRRDELMTDYPSLSMQDAERWAVTDVHRNPPPPVPMKRVLDVEESPDD
jgi:terminase small subunit-like protein